MSSPQEITSHFQSSTISHDRMPASRNGAAAGYRDDHRFAAEAAPTRELGNTSNAGSAAAPSLTSDHAAESRLSDSMNGDAPAKSVARLNLSPINTDLPVEGRPAEVLRLAIETFPQTDTWVVFYREILGVEGVVRKLFTTIDELRQWEASKEFDEVHTMLAALRSHDNGKGDTAESQRMITVRLPVSLHEALKVESDESGLSINKLCITKLLHKMDARFVPQEPGKRRGRKPGPQGKREKKVAAN